MVVSPSESEVTPEVIEACRRGDRDAFRLLYEAYKDKVYSMALYFFHGDTATAADVTQQVFLKLLSSMSQFHGDAKLSTWLYRFVVNVCIDRTRRMEARATMADPATQDEVPVTVTPEDDLATAEARSAVRSAIASLAPKIRMAIVLRYFEELSYDEMASVLKCSPGTVASRLSRGHELLGRVLAPLRSAPAEKKRDAG
jgi:RNA polymerase sigma-70 factor (ECF subfamily)